jgi:hypothetical protein
MRYLFLVLLFVGCNPVKQVLRDQEKLEQVAKEVIKSGMCANDTTFITKSDTLLVVDTLIEVHTDVEVNTINDTTYLTKWKTKNITKTLTIHDTLKSYIVDNARVRLLQADSTRLNNLANEYKGKAQNRLKWLIIIGIVFTAYWFIKNRL